MNATFQKIASRPLSVIVGNLIHVMDPTEYVSCFYLMAEMEPVSRMLCFFYQNEMKENVKHVPVYFLSSVFVVHSYVLFMLWVYVDVDMRIDNHANIS
jgi:hypothetical protein